MHGRGVAMWERGGKVKVHPGGAGFFWPRGPDPAALPPKGRESSPFARPGEAVGTGTQGGSLGPWGPLRLEPGLQAAPQGCGDPGGLAFSGDSSAGLPGKSFRLGPKCHLRGGEGLMVTSGCQPGPGHGTQLFGRTPVLLCG